MEAGDGVLHLLPAIYAVEACGRLVVRGREEQARATENVQVTWLIVDEEIGTQYGFIAAEDVMRGGNEREMPLQPPVLWAEGVWNHHGLRGDENLVSFGERFENVLCARH